MGLGLARRAAAPSDCRGAAGRLRDAEFKQIGIASMGVRRKLLAAARRLRALYLKPAGGFGEWLESNALDDYAEVRRSTLTTAAPLARRAAALARTSRAR